MSGLLTEWHSTVHTSQSGRSKLSEEKKKKNDGHKSETSIWNWNDSISCIWTALTVWKYQCTARVSKQGVLLGGKRCTQTVKSKGNQNSAWSVDQSVNEDLWDSIAPLNRNTSCWSEDAGIWGGQTRLQKNAFHRQYRIMVWEEMEGLGCWMLMNVSDLMLLCFH